MINWAEHIPPSDRPTRTGVLLALAAVAAIIVAIVVSNRQPDPLPRCYEDEFAHAGRCYAIDNGRDPK